MTVQIQDVTTGTWTTIWTGSSNANTWRTESIALDPSYTNKTVQLRFIVDKDTTIGGTAGYYYDNLLLDDVKVGDPASLGTSEVAANKASEKVYPNPFTDFVDISDVKGAVSARVADASGRMVANFAKAEGRLDLSNLNSGMYILSVTKKDGTTSSFKIIKK